MALKKSAPVESESSKSSLSPELMSQFQNNFASTPVVENETTAESTEEPKKTAKKPNYKNIFNVHMGTGDKARLKTFCAAHEVPINTFILFAIEHLIDEIEEGKCTVSKSGIRTIKKEV
ncbi:MAG: hypothetical protein SPL22_08780 [Treponema sp.]|jgi:hypothetical protein|uniref:hypothetical protein n=1 Tax=Treponema sp. TaxID=166 RepID=UPI002A90DEDA|nr:hypothetical protein [Treponema sp.]MDY6397814.1 hypothetical protein [Treponema sp.]